MKTSRGLQLQQSHGNGSCCSEGFPIREIQRDTAVCEREQQFVRKRAVNMHCSSAAKGEAN